MTTSYTGLLGFRDVGGLCTNDGGQVRRGLLYRSGTPQFLASDAARALIADTGIRATIDLRLPHEVAVEGRGPPRRAGGCSTFRTRSASTTPSPRPPRWPRCPVTTPLVTRYLAYLAQDAAGVVSLISRLLDPGVLPVLVHCTVGKDRTGVAVALLLDAIGVRREDIVTDYATAPDDVVASMHRLREMASYGAATDLYPPQVWTAPT